MKKLAIFAVLPILAICFWLQGCTATEPVPVGFSNADIAGVEASIRAKYTKEGFDVKDVHFIKVSDKKLSGFTQLEKGWVGHNGDCNLIYGICVRQATTQNTRNQMSESEAGSICVPPDGILWM